jgi:hypothetical protein
MAYSLKILPFLILQKELCSSSKKAAASSCGRGHWPVRAVE